MPETLLRAVIGRSLLQPVGPWQIVEVLDRVDSTNAESLRHARPWRVVTAHEQTAGRGRRSRPWASPAGKAVAVSMTVPMPPAGAASSPWGWLPLLTGLATHEALVKVTGAPDAFGLKWPNDVLARTDADDWYKMCGILCETTAAPDGSGHLAVAGVGVNVSLAREELPVPEATSLHLLGYDVAREDVIVAIVEAFVRRYAQWVNGEIGALRSAYRSECLTLGTRVRVHTPDGQVHEGVATAIADGGELVVDLGDGRQESYAAGDVVHVRAHPGADREGTGDA